MAPMTYKDTMTSDFFEACFQKFLLPTLDTPSIIIMDNARFHRMNMCKEQGIDCYHFLPIHPSIIPLRKYGLTSKTSQNNIVNYDAFLEALLSYSCFSRLYSVIGQLRNSRWDHGGT